MYDPPQIPRNRALRASFTANFMLLALLITLAGRVAADEAGPNQLIESNHLGYSLHYRVYVPPAVGPTEKLPSLYVTDGQWYLDAGQFTDVLDREIAAGSIQPVIVVFVDSRDPDNLGKNRRNDEFMCNKDYAYFYRDELIPTIEAAYPVIADKQARVILGVSFGGLNAACFGLVIPDTFSGIAMHSPANALYLGRLARLYSKTPRLPLRIFFSIGTRKDNISAARRFKNALVAKEYDLTYIEVPHGHNWENWQPLIDDALITFFSVQK